ncbi:serine hydrolase [Candidatus Uabimicrobium amorphum]|uniref:Penicillin-binding protein n=1 Tax=Uabimicrobium amorphum TaxID=2596890 RepID=A0A5S9II44_UABAM|nr:serine hydrolase [Candidatus Uabimicrobium amorphum]BBM81970.1 penicillin-binding protein [Candidatus Uabimicrobium amorphum]
MYRTFTICILVCHSFLLAQTTLQQEIDKMIQPIIEYKWNVGVVVGVYQKDKEDVVLSYGFSDKTTQQKTNVQTVFEIASISKAFTGILLSKMILENKLAMDDTIDKFIDIDSEVGKITLQHLVTHTSGLPSLPTNITPKDIDNPYTSYTDENILDFLRKYKLTRKPGKQYQYSNLGVGLLGKILQIQAKKSYESMVKEEICQPLSMSHTAITKDKKWQVAVGHDLDLTPVPFWDWPVLQGAGSLHSNVKDGLRFIKENIAAHHAQPKTTLQQALVKSHKTLRHVSGKLKIGTAWHKLGEDVVWHNGGSGGFRSFLGFNPQREIGIIVLTNTANSLDYVGFNILNFLSGEKMQEVVVRKTAEVDPKIFSSYLGTYKLGMLKIQISQNNDKLMVKIADQPAYRIYPETETKFFWKIVNAQLEFVKNKEGNVNKIILHQFGRQMPAVRIK